MKTFVYDPRGREQGNTATGGDHVGNERERREGNNVMDSVDVCGFSYRYL